MLSVGWIRYISAATFIGSIFVAAMMHDFTRGFDGSYTIQPSLGFFRNGGIYKQAIGALFVATVILTFVTKKGKALKQTYVLNPETLVQKAADFGKFHPPGRSP